MDGRSLNSILKSKHKYFQSYKDQMLTASSNFFTSLWNADVLVIQKVSYFFAFYKTC